MSERSWKYQIPGSAPSISCETWAGAGAEELVLLRQVLRMFGVDTSKPIDRAIRGAVPVELGSGALSLLTDSERGAYERERRALRDLRT